MVIPLSHRVSSLLSSSFSSSHFFIAFFALCPGSREGGVAFDDDAVSLDIGGLVVRGELAVYDVVLLLRWRAPYDG